jgi:FkbM family methyltransferase
LRHQTYRDFEVVVVQGPCEDETPELLAERTGQLKVIENPERNLCKSRNLGIDLASGDVVAFIDDDGVPESRWLEELATAYDDERVGGAGGLVYDQTGVHLQYRYAVCDRAGRTDFDRTPPFDDFNRPGADPFVYLQGTNMSFRREALAEIGGFDENIEYIWDESDLALHLIDAGWQLRPIDGAAVHHKMLPSHLRREKAVVTDPFVPVKNRSYFALRNGPGKRPMEDVLRSLTDYLDLLRNWTADSERVGRFTAREAQTFLTRMEEGFETGVAQGMRERRAGRALAPRDADAFVPYPVLQPEGERLSLCFVSLDYPPGPMGGIARYTADLARGIAESGHDVHVVTRSDPPYRLDFEDGVWVHRHPESERLLPALDEHPLRDNLAHCATVWRAVDRVDRRFGLDLVAGNVWIAEALLCALDPRWPAVLTCSTPIRTMAATQPGLAAKPHTEWQAKLEDVALARAQHLQPVSHANLETVRRETPAAADVPATVVWHGMIDRAEPQGGRPVREDGAVEILFVGRLEPRKGVDTLIEAAIDLLRERPEALLRIVGADNPYPSEDPRPYPERVDARLADDPDLRRRLVFEGEVSDEELDRLFASCDVFCAPSRYESFGLINVEAMMFSRPVVSCRAGGIPEVVADGETGLLVEPDDVAGLRDALLRLVDDPELRARMGAAGRERFEREFDNDVAVARTLEVHRDVLRSHESDAIAPRDAEDAVSAALPALLKTLGGVDTPEEATTQLLEPSAFPHDYRAAVLRLMPVSNREFVEGLYQAILRRDPDPEALAAATVSLNAGASTRLGVVREMATSDEAKLLGVDASFLERLGTEEPTELERRVRDAFWRDDETFAQLLCDTLVTANGRPEPDTIRARVAAGEDRRAILHELLDRHDVRERLPLAAGLRNVEFLTADDLRRRLERLAEVDDDAFVDEAYRLLLGREADPGAAGHRARLGSASRKSVLVEIASSAEAQRRGIDPVVVLTAAGQVSQLAAVPRHGLARVPGAGRIRRMGRRVFRDPQVGQLRSQLERYAASQQAAIDELSRRVDLAADDERIARLVAEVQAIDADVHDLREHVAERVENEVARLDRSFTDMAGGLGATHGTYIGDDRILVSTTWGGKLLTSSRDLSLTPELVAHGVYEVAFTNYLLRTLRPGQTVIDVGANIGLHTILMASYVGAEGRVIAYEPNPDVGVFLRENIALNWFNDRVTVKPLAVSAEPGRVTLHITERFMGNSSLLQPGEGYFREAPMDTTRTLDVDAEPLDAIAEELGDVDLVKIDVEGAEHLVLQGMRAMLDRGAVRTVSMEFYRDRMGAEWETFCNLLRDRARVGWAFHVITVPGELEPADLEDLLKIGRYAQVVMTRPPDRDEASSR